MDTSWRKPLSCVNIIAWLLLLSFAAAALWQLRVVDPALPRWISGLMLVVSGLLAGLRIGAESAIRFAGDLIRLNKYLAEQNRDLVETNHELLKSILAQNDPQNDIDGQYPPED